MGDIDRFSETIIDYAERLADVADAAKGKGARHSVGARWMLLPAAGAGLYALATSTSFTRRTKDVMEQAKARASDLPEDLFNRVRQASTASGQSRSSNGTQSRSGSSNRSRRKASRRKSSSTSRSRASAR